MPESKNPAATDKKNHSKSDETRRMEFRPQAGTSSQAGRNFAGRPLPGFKAKSENEAGSDKKISRQSETPLAALRNRTRSLNAEKKNKSEAWKIEKDYGAKIYQLTAYTTVEKIEKKFRTEERQASLRKIIGTLLIILIILIFLSKFLSLGGKIDLDKIEGGTNPPSFISVESSEKE